MMTPVVAKTADLKADLDLEWLLKVRTVVALISEMDLASWWNSNGHWTARSVGSAPRTAAKRTTSRRPGRFAWSPQRDRTLASDHRPATAST
jgi:hypothetical protein